MQQLRCLRNGGGGSEGDLISLCYLPIYKVGQSHISWVKKELILFIFGTAINNNRGLMNVKHNLALCQHLAFTCMCNI